MSSTEISFTNRTTGGGRRRNAGLRTAALARAPILVSPSPLAPCVRRRSAARFWAWCVRHHRASCRIARNEASCIHPSPIRNARRPIACRARVRRTSRQRTRREKVHGLAIRRLSVTHDARLCAALKRAEPLGVHKRRRSALPLAHSSKLRVVSPSNSEYGRIGGMGKGRSGDKGQGIPGQAPGERGRATACAWRTAGRETRGHDEPGKSVARPTAATSPEGARPDRAEPNKRSPELLPGSSKHPMAGYAGLEPATSDVTGRRSNQLS